MTEFRQNKHPGNDVVADQDDGHVQRNFIRGPDVKQQYGEVHRVQDSVQDTRTVLQREVVADPAAARRQEEMDLVNRSDLVGGDDSRVPAEVDELTLSVFGVYLVVDELFVFGRHQISRHFVV